MRPYPTTDALRADFPPATPVIVMHKNDDVPTETRALQGGGTLTVPVLAALRDSKVASKSTVGAFDFAAMDPDAVALLLPKAAGKTAEIRVVTKAAGGALLCADLDGMLSAVVAIADNEALRAFPGGEFLIDALRMGLAQAKEELNNALTKPDATGKSLLEQIEEAVPAARPYMPAKVVAKSPPKPKAKPKANRSGKSRR